MFLRNFGIFYYFIHNTLGDLGYISDSYVKRFLYIIGYAIEFKNKAILKMSSAHLIYFAAIIISRATTYNSSIFVIREALLQFSFLIAIISSTIQMTELYDCLANVLILRY
ncbi:hypothetical protein HZS_5672 [Henneguya salminicola]|nr:hypothetical protein HZS_5672 [Henneguya salminicola]